MAGLAQKGGAVYSHIRIANSSDDIHAIRVAAGGADLVLGGDIVVVVSKKVLGAIKPGNTRMIVNTAEFLPGDALVFGSESRGLEDALLAAWPEQVLQIPMRTDCVRSLNLADSVAIVLYEALRQIHQRG